MQDISTISYDGLELSLKDTFSREALAYIVDSGPKNIMPITTSVTSETKRGITATYDLEKGTITLNGTHDGNGDANFYLYVGNAADQKKIPAGSYHLSGCPEGGNTATYCLIVNYVGGSPTYKVDSGSGLDFTISTTGLMVPYIRIRKPAGQTVSFTNAVFRPMICDKAAWEISKKHVPYKPSNQELYEMIKALQNQ